MLAQFAAAVVNTASGNDRYITVLSDVEIIVHKIRETGLRYDDGNMNTFFLCARFDIYLDTGFVFLRHDFYVGGRVAAGGSAV